MLAVVSWCKSGLKRINQRDLVLTGILALVVLSYFLVNVIIKSLLANPYLPSSLFTILEGAAQVFNWITIVLALIILSIAFNVEKWLKRHWPNTLTGLITYPLLFLFFPFSFIMVPLAWLTIFSELIVRYYGQQINHLRKNTFNPQVRPVPLDANLERKLRENFSTGLRNVVAYSGFKPFAGAGLYLENLSWSFVIDTSKGAFDPSNFDGSAKRLTPKPFTLSSLYDAVGKDVWALDIKDVLEIEGKLYVRGQYLPEKPAFFNAAAVRPVTSVAPQLVEQYKEHPTEDVRYYQCLRFNFWRGEMILTVFLRFVQRGKELYIEIDYLLLPPMKPNYYWADEKELTPIHSKIWELYKRSLDNPIQMWLGAPFRLLRGYFYTSEQHRLARYAANAPAFDYGASTSVRQSASDDQYHLLFQKLDEKMYLQIIEKQILETAINFLDAHQIDATELRRREQVILNNNTTNNSTINNNNGTFNNSGQLGNVSGGQVNTNSGSPQAAPPPQTEKAGKTQQFDVCIVCALIEEASAVINEFTDRCNGVQFKRAFSRITGYEYKHTVIKNSEGDELTVLIIWMPFTGPTETVNSVRSLLDEFHPRFVAMAGLCAGYEKKVELGDLVAAAYAFHYEEGRIVADENGQNKLLPEWKTHGTAKRIVQYINSFTDWKAPVIEMKKRKLGRELQQEELPQCLIAPIASGMAVQANNPFPHLLEHNRKALFLDQEVAAFYQTLSEFPDVYFLAVKGVCDYGNIHKNDNYHDYAVRASAIYLLYFIQSYVLDITMPR